MGNSPVKLETQYVGIESITVRLVNSMLPVYSDELVPLSVNTPPETPKIGEKVLEQASQKLTSGESSRQLVAGET